MRRRTTTWMATLLSGVLILAACGGGDDDPAGDPGDPADTAAPDDGEENGEAAPAGDAQQGGSITVQQQFDACCGTPFGTQDPSVMQILSGTVYSKLVEFAVGDDITEPEIVPDLAESWDISEDGLTYTFDLRDDVFWHDIEPVNGRQFVADDVIATFEQLQEGSGQRYPDDPPDSMIYPHQYQVEPIENMIAEDDHTLVFELSEPYAPLMDYLAYHFNYIMPREGFEGEFDFNETWIGTGPFMVESYEPDVEWVLERNPNYYQEGLPYLDEIRLPILSDTGAAVSAIRSGRLDVMVTQATEEAEELESEGYPVLSQPHLPVSFFMNQGEEPFDDLNVRRAVIMAVDWDGMGENIRGEVNKSSFIRPDLGAAALSEEEIDEIRPHDPDQARELLAEAGFPDGFEANLLVMELSVDDVREAQWIQQDLAEVGIDVELEIVDPGTAVQRRREFQFEMHKAARSTHLHDQVWIDFLPGALDNHSQIDDEQLVEMFEASRATTDIDERDEIMREMQRYVETEIASVLYPYTTNQYTIHNERVQNFQTSFIFHGRRYAEVWVDD